MKTIFAALLASLALALSGCYTVPETGRRALVLISPAEEATLGAQSFAQLRTEERVSQDPRQNERVLRVGRRIAQAVGDAMPAAKWEFVVFDSPDVNAFALPGGKVGVYTGLLRLAESDDELATVIGHEIAHVTARHGAERMSEAAVLGAVGQLGASAVNSRWGGERAQQFMTAYGLGATLGRVLPHSRSAESEADFIGLRYAAKAGYDPRAAINFWVKMARHKADAGGGGTPAFLSTHPTDEDRIAKLQEQVPQVMPLYQASVRTIGDGREIGEPTRTIGEPAREIGAPASPTIGAPIGDPRRDP